MRIEDGLEQQLAYVKKTVVSKYPYARLLTDDMGVYREDRNGNPNILFSI
jgi:hypothetical protein